MMAAVSTTSDASAGVAAAMFSSLADCPVCRVQGAVVETWDVVDAAQRDGDDEPAATTSRCRMCGRTLENGVEVQAARSLAHLRDVDEALAAWAKEEGCASAAELVQSSFVLADVGKVHAALILGEPIETSFDVMGYLFSHMGGGGPGVDGDDVPFVDAVLRGPDEALTIPGERGLDPRNELLALASVAAADGKVVPVERAFLDALAKARGIERLSNEELRVFRPDEAGPVGSLLDRERVLEKMIEVAFLDAISSPLEGVQVDDSEVRVIRAYARAWGVDPQRVEGWLREWHDNRGSLFSRALRKVAKHLFPEA
jgi:hypothetical protein